MKTLLLSISLLAALSASAQSIQIRIVANDGSTTSTNILNISALHAAGAKMAWQKDSASKTNAGSAAINFSAFVMQEITDKGAEWQSGGAEAEIRLAGATNSIPPRLIVLWPTLSAAQKTNAVKFVNEIGQ